MSYWAWLARMLFFSILGSASVLVLMRTHGIDTPKPEEPFLLPQAQVVPFDPEYPLPANDPNYRPTLGSSALPPIPKSRLAPLLTYEAYSDDRAPLDAPPLSASAPTSSSPTPPTSESAASPVSPAPPPVAEFNLGQSLALHNRLFETPISLGMLAIGVAEGNYRVFVESGTLYVEQTASYFGHVDPGNLSWGERVTNYGPCSDQGRSAGDLALAEQMCLQRSRDRLPTNLQDLAASGINPDRDLEAVINTADLYNQASPVHSRLFPQALRIAYQGGLQGTEAMAWARTASFYVNSRNQLDLENGRNVASGLLGICAREGRVATEWDCVYADQLRRANAIASVLNQYFQVYPARS